MRKILRQLRKSLKTACLSAALVTCWNIGQTANADIIQPTTSEKTVKFSGTVTPSDNDIFNLYLIYATGVSSFIVDLFAVKLGNCPSSETTEFSFFANIYYDGDIHWFAAGLYGDISGNQYNNSINGVTLGIDAAEGDPWDDYIAIDEGIMFDNILNDDTEALEECTYSIPI